MHLEKPRSFAEFSARAESLLLAFEVEHGLIYGIAKGGEPPGAYCAVVIDDDRPVAAAIRTIAKAAISRETVPGAIALLAADLLADPDCRGAVGPPPSLYALEAASGRPWRAGMAQGIYECRAVRPPPAAPGHMRAIEPADLPVLTRWIGEFHREAAGDEKTPDEASAIAERHLASGAAFVWVLDGTPVSYTGAFSRTPNGVRIGPVYTPPDRRGLGYAASLVAEVTHRQLESGRRFTYLYTDLSNPTSNALYERVGYRRVSEAADRWLV